MLYTRQEIVSRLRKEIEAKRPIFVPNAGCGLSAKLQMLGGADIITISPTSYWRLKGYSGSMAAGPYSNMQQIVFDIAPEITLNVGDTPVIALTGCHNPMLPHKEHLEKLKAMGISGITPWMYRSFGKVYNDYMSASKIGWENEVEFVKMAHDMDMLTCVYCFDEEDTRIFAEAGADILSPHVGKTVGGLTGGKVKMTLEEAAEECEKLYQVARSVNPEVILLAHGGPIVTPEDAKYIYDHTSADGFVGGSAAERLPMEKAIVEVTKAFKSYD